jgi:hypothetical protein
MYILRKFITIQVLSFKKERGVRLCKFFIGMLYLLNLGGCANYAYQDSLVSQLFHDRLNDYEHSAVLPPLKVSADSTVPIEPAMPIPTEPKSASHAKT